MNKNRKVKNILITGSGGLIGSEAVNYYCERGFEVIGIDNNMRSYFFGKEGSTEENVLKNVNLFKNYKHFEDDIRDQTKMEEIFKKFQFDLIIHTAAQPSHDWAAKEPLTDFTVNADATLLLLENFRKYSPHGVFIFTSTNKVYGDGPNFLPLIEKRTRYEIDPRHKYKNGISEDMPIDNNTHTLFGVSKTAADLMVQEYGRYFNLKTGVFRGGCLTGSKHAGVEQHGFLSYLIKCILTGRKYTIFGYKGKQVRDNIHAHDLISAFDAFYQNPKGREVYNIGGSRFANISILEAVRKIEEISGRKARIEYNEQNRIGDHTWYVSDVSKFKSHYPDWEYKYNIDATIADICRNSSFSKKVFALSVAKNLDFWKEKNWYFHNYLKKIFKETIQEESNVLQVGYGLGDILSSLFPKKGISVDTDESLVITASQRYPSLKFLLDDPSKVNLKKEIFDYVIFPNSVDHFKDIQTVLEKVSNKITNKSKIVLTSINPRWEFPLLILEKLNLKVKEPPRNWLRLEDLINIVEISGYKVTESGFRMLIPTHIPFLSSFINEYIQKVKFLSRFCLEQFIVAEKQRIVINKNLSGSVIIPLLNDKDNIESVVNEISQIKRRIEIIIVESNLKNEVRKNLELLTNKYISLKIIHNEENTNKNSLIQQGLNSSKGDILIILDPQLSLPSQDIERFFDLLSAAKADFINGTRLIYPIKEQKLRHLHILGNLVFSWIFSWILGQRITDTLCEAKAILRKDYIKIKSKPGNNIIFDLLFKAAENNLKIVELPIHYKRDFPIQTKTQTIKFVAMLVKMCLLGFWKFKITPRQNI